MKPTTQTLTAIAREHLCIDRIESRNYDPLDFQKVSMCGIKAALKAAFDAGAASVIVEAASSPPRQPAAASHTPGPWHYEVSVNCPDVWEITADFCESSIAEIPRWQDDDSNDSQEAEANARLFTAAPAQAIILDLVQHGLMTLEEGEAEFDGVMYWFDHRQADWCVGVVDAIGWDHARLAIVEAMAA